jgi:hypothetical protein
MPRYFVVREYAEEFAMFLYVTSINCVHRKRYACALRKNVCVYDKVMCVNEEKYSCI